MVLEHALNSILSQMFFYCIILDFFGAKIFFFSIQLRAFFVFHCIHFRFSPCALGYLVKSLFYLTYIYPASGYSIPLTVGILDSDLMKRVVKHWNSGS